MSNDLLGKNTNNNVKNSNGFIGRDDLLEDRRTELRHTKPDPVAFPYLYRSCTPDICKISTFSNFQMFGWIKSRAKKKICGFPVSRPYLAFRRQNPDPKLFYWITLVSVST
jgi:hypothetical protein